MIMKAINVKHPSLSVDLRCEGGIRSVIQQASFSQPSTRVISNRIAESELKAWCGRFVEPDLQNRVLLAFALAHFPLKNVECDYDDQAITLSGVVACYHHIQVAIELARPLAEGRRIDCQIKVVEPATSVSSD
jgi:hypothetical protein